MDELSFPLLFFLWINRIKKQKRDGERSVEREGERDGEGGKEQTTQERNGKEMCGY